MPYSPAASGMRCKPAQLLARLILDLLRHAGLGDRLVELGHLGGLALLALAELALDRRHLLAQQHLALALVERRLGLPADLLRQPQDFDAMGEQARHLVHARGDVDRLQDLLLLLRLHVHVGDGEIGELRGRLDRLDGGHEFGGRLRQQLQRFHGLRPEVDEPRLDLRSARVRLRDLHDAGDEEGPACQVFDDLKTPLALADEMVRAVGRGDVADDVGDRAHAMHVDRGRVGELGIALHEDADLALVAHRLLRGGDRLRASERDRQHQAGEQHGVAHRHDDERIGRQRRQCRATLSGLAR